MPVNRRKLLAVVMIHGPVGEDCGGPGGSGTPEIPVWDSFSPDLRCQRGGILMTGLIFYGGQYREHDRSSYSALPETAASSPTEERLIAGILRYRLNLVIIERYFFFFRFFRSLFRVSSEGPGGSQSFCTMSGISSRLASSINDLEGLNNGGAPKGWMFPKVLRMESR